MTSLHASHTPSQTQEVVEIIDTAVMQAAAHAMRQDVDELRADHFIWRRLRLPSRMRGCHRACAAAGYETTEE